MPNDIQDAIRGDLVTSTFKIIDTMRELRAELKEARDNNDILKRKLDELDNPDPNPQNVKKAKIDPKE